LPTLWGKLRILEVSAHLGSLLVNPGTRVERVSHITSGLEPKKKEKEKEKWKNDQGLVWKPFIMTLILVLLVLLMLVLLTSMGMSMIMVVPSHEALGSWWLEGRA
jgi:hypothetical protein